MNDSNTVPNHDRSTILITSRSKCDDFDLEPYLVILSGQGKQFRLHRQYNTFGRNADVDITIDDAQISRKHGVFIVYPDCIVLQDYQSTNGCYVDGIRIESHTIESTARIQAGNTLMKIEYKKNSEVESENALYKAANTDELTNILNRRAFMKQAQEELFFCKQKRKKLAIVMCDVDFFKRINDKFGHPAGDQVLRDLAKNLQMQMRKVDVVARYGGEEFIMLLPDTDAGSVSAWAERVKRKVEQFKFDFQDKIIPVTLSIGVCCRDSERISSLNAVIQKADEALYLAKKNGRNRVECI